MMNGIAIFGLNGAGKSTIAHALAKECGFFEIDVEDCYFPEQSVSRQMALENAFNIETLHLGLLPFSKPRDKHQVENEILIKIKDHPKFVLAGVTLNWHDEILEKIDSAFWIQAPVDTRLNRVQMREEKRFGSRVLAGGDMFTQQLEFRKMVGNRDTKDIEASISRLKCPVIVLDGSLSVSHNLEIIRQHLNL